jgi:hypothetical protein
VTNDAFKPNGSPASWETDDLIAPPVAAFLNETGHSLTRRLVQDVRSVLRGRNLVNASGSALDVVYMAAIYTELPLPDGHDLPDVRDFVEQCAKAVQTFEAYKGSSQEHFDSEVEGRSIAIHKIGREMTRQQADEWIERLFPNGGREEYEAVIASGMDLRVVAKGQAEDEFFAQIRERLGVSAGQKEMSSSEETSTAGQNALTCKKAQKHKLEAEAHKDPRSQDWKDAPRSAWPTYEWFMKTLIGGGHVREMLPSLDPDGRALAWLVSEGLVAEADGELVALPDPEPYHDPDERFMYWGGKEIDLWEYPRWSKDMGNPLAGKTWGRDLDEHVKALVLREKAAGHDLSPRQIAEKLQTSVDRGEHRAISVKAVQRSLKRLVDDGELVLVTYADRFRRGHRWVNIPATYADPAEALTMRRVRAGMRRKREAAEVGLAA